ncbi:hypothetical protein RSPO_c02772 [Ralstonia solanacearum Po82]|uniref:Uncharacterized protein n=1 Tax=Ralstonia solanacearum (strain Po82) TaxID=1031711 RepID=F6G532_RALS8|nr:hypothetical protein RSPO_c02772 [Ralstonia solanacearum Po82]
MVASIVGDPPIMDGGASIGHASARRSTLREVAWAAQPLPFDLP